MTPPFVLWTARLAVAGWLGRWIVQLGLPPLPRRATVIHCLWTAGWLIYAAHVFAAFAVVHHWSHAAAVEHTARQTWQLTGLEWGGGVWFNYAFTLLWLIDVGRMWTTPSRLTCPSRYDWVVDAYLAFIVVDATLVFGPRWWWGVFVVAAILTLFLRRRGGPSLSGACQPPDVASPGG